jgi:hypothetical protein
VSRLSSKPPSGREGQQISSFTPILEALVASTDGTLAAGLVDFEGESVDLASAPAVTPSGVAPSVPAFRVKLASAHWQIVVREALLSPALGQVRQLWVDASEGGFVAVALEQGYVLVLICRAGAVWSVSRRALRQAELDVSLEAGWPLPRPEEPHWRRVRVSASASGEPRAMRGGAHAREHTSLRVVTPLDALEPFERGWRVMDEAGTTVDLVREPAGIWFAARPTSPAKSLK